MPRDLVGQLHFNDRPDVVELVPRPPGRVLDVGCGPGHLGAALLSAGASEVWGVERDDALSGEAATRVTCVSKLDLDDDPIGDLPPNHFDCIVYADVLEHLIDPWRVLREQRRLLAAGGCAVISIPNVRHIRVVGPLLLSGTWRYEKEGLLSSGHLRFFTSRSMRDMIRGAGYHISTERANYAPSGMLVRRLTLGLADDFVARQRLFVAMPSE